MGGLGSGQRWSKKGVADGRYFIDTVTLKEWNLLVPGATERAGAFEWGRGGEGRPSSSVSYRLTVGRDAGTLRLLYALKSMNAELDYAVRLVTTPCHLGGRRWWFICPLTKNGVTCGRRVRKLYLCGRFFGCRACHDLTYRSRQESDKRVYAMARAGLGTVSDPAGKSVSQLGVMLRALTLIEKRLKRLDG